MSRRIARDSAGSALRRLALVLALPLLAGCSSGPVKIGPQPTSTTRLLGVGHGSGCGLLLFNLVPLGVNGRVEKAHEEAQISVGKRDVTDTKVRERWYLVPLVGTVLCTDVEETAVQ